MLLLVFFDGAQRRLDDADPRGSPRCGLARRPSLEQFEHVEWAGPGAVGHDPAGVHVRRRRRRWRFPMRRGRDAVIPSVACSATPFIGRSLLILLGVFLRSVGDDATQLDVRRRRHANRPRLRLPVPPVEPRLEDSARRGRAASSSATGCCSPPGRCRGRTTTTPRCTARHTTRASALTGTRTPIPPTTSTSGC